ncbi:hypothetical protein ACQKGI_14355 [Peribacillus muralis]|uniref:hypothetical protein n=1 Tax=Peribacillus muralis TaxID=264697 RepID=UPI003825A657
MKERKRRRAIAKKAKTASEALNAAHFMDQLSFLKKGWPNIIDAKKPTLRYMGSKISVAITIVEQSNLTWILQAVLY